MRTDRKRIVGDCNNFQGTIFGSWDFWWKANVTPASQADFSTGSGKFLRSAQWFHCDKSELQVASSGGGLTWIRLTQRRHLNLKRGKNKLYDKTLRSNFWKTYLSWVSLSDCSSSLNKSRKSERLKWRSTSSSLSTTQELSAFLWACRWNIFSSIVPVWKEYAVKENSFKNAVPYRKKAVDEALFLLTISPNTCHRLVIISGIPIGIKHYQTIGTDEVQPTAACFAAEKESEVSTVRVIEFFNDFRPFLDRHAAVQANARVRAHATKLFE